MNEMMSNEELAKLKPDETYKLPIRLIFHYGYGHHAMYQGLKFVYEKADGKVRMYRVGEQDQATMDKIRFVDDGESEIVWKKQINISKKSFLGRGLPWPEMVLTEIRIRRDFQTGHR